MIPAANESPIASVLWTMGSESSLSPKNSIELIQRFSNSISLHEFSSEDVWTTSSIYGAEASVICSRCNERDGNYMIKFISIINSK